MSSYTKPKSRFHLKHSVIIQHQQSTSQPFSRRTFSIWWFICDSRFRTSTSLIRSLIPNQEMMQFLSFSLSMDMPRCRELLLPVIAGLPRTPLPPPERSTAAAGAGLEGTRRLLRPVT